MIARKKNRKTKKNKFTKYLKGGKYSNCKRLPEIAKFINNNPHLLNITDDIEDVERELMMQDITQEQWAQADELNSHIPYSTNIDDSIDKLFKFITNKDNQGKFLKISVYIFVMYYLLMCQRPQPQIGGVKRKTRKSKKSKRKTRKSRRK